MDARRRKEWLREIDRIIGELSSYLKKERDSKRKKHLEKLIGQLHDRAADLEEEEFGE